MGWIDDLQGDRLISASGEEILPRTAATQFLGATVRYNPATSRREVSPQSGVGGGLSKLDLSDDPIAIHQFEGDLTDASGNGITLTQSVGTFRTGYAFGLRGMLKLANVAQFVISEQLELLGAVSGIMLLVNHATSGSTFTFLGYPAANSSIYPPCFYALMNDTAGVTFKSKSEHEVTESLVATNVHIPRFTPAVVGFTRSAAGLVRIFVQGNEVASGTLTLPGDFTGTTRCLFGCDTYASDDQELLLLSSGIYGSELSQERMIAKQRALLGLT